MAKGVSDGVLKYAIIYLRGAVLYASYSVVQFVKNIEHLNLLRVLKSADGNQILMNIDKFILSAIHNGGFDNVAYFAEVAFQFEVKFVVEMDELLLHLYLVRDYHYSIDYVIISEQITQRNDQSESNLIYFFASNSSILPYISLFEM